MSRLKAFLMAPQIPLIVSAVLSTFHYFNNVQVWHYDDGLTTSIGSGHSGRVAAVRISPDRRFIVSVGSEGGIFIWEMPPSTEGRAAAGETGAGGGR